MKRKFRKGIHLIKVVNKRFKNDHSDIIAIKKSYILTKDIEGFIITKLI